MRALHLSFATLLVVTACRPVEAPPPPPTPPTIPAAPAMLTATPGAGFVRLVWSDDLENEDGFVIGRVALASSATPFTAAQLTELTRVAKDQVVFRDTPALAQVWGYGVAAFNAAGVSDFTLLPAGVAALGGTGSGCALAVPSAEDPDGDGLSSEEELLGWTVRINLNGAMQFSELAVTSSTTQGDLDADGLCDAEERILRTNPGNADTDGDGLSDDREVLVFGSSPINVDSDGDSAGNSAFFDGSELSRFGTSPTLADTDGDGRSDFQEINQNSTNALVADLPQPKLELVGTVDVSVNLQLTSGAMTTSSLTRSLTRGMETSTNRTSGTASSTTSEMSLEASASVSAGFPDGVSASASASYGQSETRMSESSTSFEQSSTSSARDGYAQATSRELNNGETIVDGKVAVQLNIVNAGTRTFELKDLVVTALTRDPNAPGSLASVASLTLPAAAASVTLGEGQSAGPFRVEATVPANVALDLLANPSGLVFKPASFQLIDRTGTDFAFTVGETTSNRTALLVIDYDGERPLEQYRVATNVARLDGGRLVGLTMKAALEAVGLTAGTGYEAAPNPNGVQKLVKVRNLGAQRRGTGTGRFWAVIAADNTASEVPASTRLLQRGKPFEELLLMPRDKVYLAYVADDDGDGLFSREERLYGTSDQLADSDGDGLSDREEIREGWNVFATLPIYGRRPKVFSDPSRADADQDHLTDSQERQKGTDPNRPDTDGDGINDDVDVDPLRGLSTPLLAGFGTLGNTIPLDLVVHDDGSLVVLGTGGVDVDGDGLLTNSFNHSVFIAGFDAQGRKKWAHELELLGPSTAMTSLAKGAQGHTYFYEELYTGAFPGAGNGFQLVELDGQGAVVSIVPVSGGNAGWRPITLKRTSNGDFVAMGRGPFANGNLSHRVLVFSASGATVGFREFLVGNQPPFYREAFFDASSAGVVLQQNTCELAFFDRTMAPLGVRNVCSTVPNIAQLVLRDDGSVYLANQSLTVLQDPMGVVRWVHDTQQANEGVTSLVVDRVGRVFRTAQVNSLPRMELIDALGVSLDTVLPPPAVFLTTSAVDSQGNYFQLGQMSDGLGGRLPQLGSFDLVMMRNPQLLFP